MKKYKECENPNDVLVLIDGAYRGTLSKTAKEFQEWLTAGNVPDPADPEPPAQTVYKEKNSIIIQIAQSGKYDLAETELAKLPNWQQALWHGAYKIAYDDTMVRQLLTDIGMNAETVMANATNWGG
jgi:hypothetical protein